MSSNRWMSSVSDHVLVVSVDPVRLDEYQAALKPLTQAIMPAMTFDSAKKLLMVSSADVLLTEIELDQLSGFYLAILARGRTRSIRTVVVGPPDEFMEHDLRMMDAAYVSSGDMDDVMEAVREAIIRKRPRRRWSRRKPRVGLLFEVDGQPVRVLDMSYGGVRVAVMTEPNQPPPASVVLGLPQYDLQERATSLWVRSAGRDLYWCGFAVDPSQTRKNAAWRSVVENVATGS